MSHPLVEAMHVTKEFELGGGAFGRVFARRRRRLLAVDDVSLAIHQGETLGLVGESGSGKSTLARLLLRLIRPTDGGVCFDGQDISGLGERALRPLRRGMQIIFQNPYASLNPRQSVRQILSLPLRLHFKMTERERRDRLDELLRQVGLSPDHAGRYPHQLSGGMRQRVAIARALAVRPEFIICDEPVSALDVSIQAQILALLQRLQQEFHLTYLFISHDLAVVRQLADRIAVMQRGKVVEIGSAEQVIDRPQHPYTQMLLASAPELP